MAPPELHRLILAPLQRTGIEYMVTGGVAAIAYGEPQLTNDVDIVLAGTPPDAGRLAAEFAESDYYVPPPDALERELGRTRHGHFNIIHNETGLRADVYVSGDDPLSAWAMQRRHTESIGPDAIWFAPIEYVIVRKLEYFTEGGSTRHLRDIRGMLRISGDLIDQESLYQLIHDRGLQAAWEEARRK